MIEPGLAPEPRSLADRVCAAAIEAAEREAAGGGRIVVMVALDSPPAGEPNGSTSGGGFETPEETIGWALDHLRQAAAAVAVSIAVFPVSGGQG
jgi:hypothetical protein